MKNLFVEFSIAEELKKKGFDEPCIAEYYRGVFEMNKSTNEYTKTFYFICTYVKYRALLRSHTLFLHEKI